MTHFDRLLCTRQAMSAVYREREPSPWVRAYTCMLVGLFQPHPTPNPSPYHTLFGGWGWWGVGVLSEKLEGGGGSERVTLI